MTNVLVRPRMTAIVVGLVLAAVVFATVRPASESVVLTADAASSDYFLKIEGIEGESTKDKHKNEIEILSWSWGMSNSGSMASGTGGGAGKASFQDISLTASVGKASPKLFLLCATGERIRSAKLTATRKAKGGTEDYLRYTLTDVICVSTAHAGTSSDVPAETFSLNYGKIEIEYLPKGSTTWEQAGWDLGKNTKI